MTSKPMVITLKEDVRIPDTNIILEKGETIRVYPKQKRVLPKLNSKNRKKRVKEQELTRLEATRMDKNGQGQIEVYVDTDEYTGERCVFGINSGFSYASPPNPEAWIENQGNFVRI